MAHWSWVAWGLLVPVVGAFADPGPNPPSSLLPPTPTLTVGKSSATGNVVLSWTTTAGSCSVLRSREARFFEGSSVQLVNWGSEQGTYSDGVLNDGNSYFYSIESDDAASHRASISQMLAHAENYGPAAYYTAPAVFDQWMDVFRGHHIVRSNQNVVASVTLAQCGFGDCTVPLDTLCIADPDGAGPASSTDPDGDGMPEFSAGDVVFVGSAVPGLGWDPKHLAHVIATVLDGDGIACPAGVRNQWRLADRIVPLDEPVAPGAPMTNLWLNWSHPVESGYFLLGYQLGKASRANFGSHGPELLPVSPAEATCSLPGGWTSDDAASHPLASVAFPIPQTVDRLQCTTGTGGQDCLAYASPYRGWVESAAPIPVLPGASYIVSGVVSPSTSGRDYFTLVTDASSPGTDIEIPQSLYAFDNAPGQLYLDRRFGNGWANRFWFTLSIPGFVDHVKLRYVKGDSAADVPLLDDVSLKSLTEHVADDGKPGHTANFLINDPGTRNIVITGDSWAHVSHSIAAGLSSALTDRYPGETFNIVAVGQGGANAAYELAEWETLVAPYDPLYAVIVVGANDCLGTGGPVPEGTFIANLTRIAIKSLAHGTIPIFVGVAPVTLPDGTLFETCHAFRDHERRALLNLVP